MRLRPLLFNEAVLNNLASLKAFAEQNVLDYRKPPEFIPGDTPQFTRLIPVGYKVVFTHCITFNKTSMQLLKARILSISVPTEGKLPSVDAAFAIAEHLGFNMDNGMLDGATQFDFEEISPIHSAIRLSQVIEEVKIEGDEKK